jgi:hypothetical protein
MEPRSKKWLSVELKHGGWFVEPLGEHIYLHIVQKSDTGEVMLITTTGPDAATARQIITEGQVLCSTSLFNLMEANRKAEVQAAARLQNTQPGT